MPELVNASPHGAQLPRRVGCRKGTRTLARRGPTHQRRCRAPAPPPSLVAGSPACHTASCDGCSINQGSTAQKALLSQRTAICSAKLLPSPFQSPAATCSTEALQHAPSTGLAAQFCLLVWGMYTPAKVCNLQLIIQTHLHWNKTTVITLNTDVQHMHYSVLQLGELGQRQQCLVCPLRQQPAVLL